VPAASPHSAQTPSPAAVRAVAIRVGIALGGALAAAWIHARLWPLAAGADRAAFAAALGIAVVAVAELLRAASGRDGASGVAAHDDRLVRTFFEHTPTAVAMLDRELRYIVHSRAWTSEYALGDASLVGRHHYEVFPEIPDRWKQIHARCLDGAAENSDQDEFVRPDGSRQWLRWDCRPWYGPDGSIGGLTFMSQDITEFKRAELERARHNQELLKATEALTLQADALGRAMEEAQTANRAKSEFLANISHEIRTPLTAILGYAHFLKDPASGPAERVVALDRLSAASEHLASLLDDVLDLTKIEAGRMTLEASPIDPALMARDVVAMFSRRAADKGLRLALIVDDTVPSCTHADPTRLRQILSNLVGNALKFTAAGSVVVHVRCPDPASIAFEVTDTGIGIEEANVSRLFQPFTQADGSTTRRFGGTGLGLRIVRKLAVLMNGELAVSSRFNHGSTFALRIPLVHRRPAPDPRIQLPITTPSAPAAPPCSLSDAAPDDGGFKPLAPTSPGPLSGRTVLVIDDSPDNLLLAATHLRRAGAWVSCVEGGAAALCTADTPARRLAFDLVLLDLHMPELDGYAVLDMMRRVGFAAPIVAFTAYSSAAERSRALDAGFAGFIGKPFTPGAIIESCQRLLAARPQRRAA